MVTTTVHVELTTVLNQRATRLANSEYVGPTGRVETVVMDSRTDLNISDEQWARDFVHCKIPNCGRSLGETIEVLVQKFRAIREHPNA